MALNRMYLLLEPDQKKNLDQLAKRTGKSVSALARQFLEEGIQRQLEKENDEKARHMAALQQAARLAEETHQKYGGKLNRMDVAGTINKMREERDEQLFGNFQGD